MLISASKIISPEKSTCISLKFQRPYQLQSLPSNNLTVSTNTNINHKACLIILHKLKTPNNWGFTYSVSQLSIILVSFTMSSKISHQQNYANKIQIQTISQQKIFSSSTTKVKRRKTARTTLKQLNNVVIKSLAKRIPLPAPAFNSKTK